MNPVLFQDNVKVFKDKALMVTVETNNKRLTNCLKFCCRCSVIKVADNESDDQTFGPHNREKRGFFEGLQFRLEAPSVDWRKVLGSTSLGGSFGFIMSNYLALKIGD